MQIWTTSSGSKDNPIQSGTFLISMNVNLNSKEVLSIKPFKLDFHITGGTVLSVEPW